MSTVIGNFSIDHFDCRNQADINRRWTRWLNHLNLFFTYTKVVDDADKINQLRLFAGGELDEIYNQNQTDDETYAQVCTRISNRFNPTVTAQLNRYHFRNVEQFDEETFDDFVARVREAAKLCQFANREDTEIGDQIIQRCQSEKLKSHFLKLTTKYTLKDIITKVQVDSRFVHLGLKQQA